MDLIEIIRKNNYRTVSIVGLAKNAGKTVVLNYLIEKSIIHNMTIGITSIGRDGEKIDVVTNTEKPSIFVTKGMYVATGKNAMMVSDIFLEIIESTGITTPMGEVIISKVMRDGYIQLAGPVSASHIKYVTERLSFYGAEVVFVDGAIDRRAASSPAITDACIIATGAVLSRDMKKVISMTAYAVECFKLEEVSNNIKQIILKNNETSVIQNFEEAIIINEEINLVNGKKISEKINENTTHVFIKGAITSKLFKDICENKFIKNIIIVIEDGTKIFIDLETWNDLKNKKLTIKVLNKIDVIAVTLNPVSPEGYYFNSEEFKNKISHYITNAKIIDVVSGSDV
ncbi:MAG: hypothetical protein PHT02_13235 [Tissierellia bacterium]|nr:hypothetical protein [Tissierellia bacterium]